jgi:hypothetical protein
MPDPFPTYEVLLIKRGRSWKWRGCTKNGNLVMLGSESSRPPPGTKQTVHSSCCWGQRATQLEMPLGAHTVMFLSAY